jgi:glycopeptide antibiotics resistance protein
VNSVWRKRMAWNAVVLITAWLLSMTLRPGSQVNHANLVPLAEKFGAVACILAGCRGTHEAILFLLVDGVGNLLVFVPFGAALALATSPSCSGQATGRHGDLGWWLRITAAGFALSLGIESVQLAIPTRTTDIDDVIFNTLGTAAGAALVWVLWQRAVRTTGESTAQVREVQGIHDRSDYPP